MSVYILLLVLPCLFRFAAIGRGRNGRLRLRVGKSWPGARGNLLLPVFFVILFYLVALRAQTVGSDTANYAYYFSKYRQCSWEAVGQADEEWLFVVLIRLVGVVSDDYQVFLAVTAWLTVIPLAKLYLEDRRQSVLKMLLFLNMPIFVLLFSGIRQCLAMAVGIWIYRQVRRRRPLRFLLGCLIAMGFHHSAFILLPMYWLCHHPVRKRHLLWVVPGIVLIYVCNRPIFTVLTGLLANYSSKYDITIQETGATTMLLLFALLAVLCYTIPQESLLDKEIRGQRTMLLFALVLQCFAPLHTLSMRLNYYYILFIPMVVPKCLAVPRRRYRQVAMLANVVLCLLLAAYFLMKLVRADNVLKIVPYMSF